MFNIEVIEQGDPENDLKAKYSELDRLHHPLKETEVSQLEEADYPEIDEQRYLKMTKRVFDINSFEAPNEENNQKNTPIKENSLIDDAQSKSTHNAFARLVQAHSKMEKGIKKIRTFHPSFSPETIYKPADIQIWLRRFAAQVGKALGQPIQGEKSMMRDHLIEKRDYWERAICYLYHKKTEGIARKEDEDLLDEVEAIQLAHVSYLITRSACHHLDQRRKNNDLTLQHAYEVMIIEVNFYKEIIDKTEDPQLKRKLYDYMKKAIIRSILHDYLEDFTIPYGPLDPDFLKDKLTELTSFDTRNEVASRVPYDPRDPDKIQRPTMHYWASVERTVMPELEALIKPANSQLKELQEETGEKEPHIRIQIIEGLRKDSIVPTFLTKLADRLNNLHSLEGLSISRQYKKIAETLELIQLGRSLTENERTKNHILRPYIEERLQILENAAINEIDRILASNIEKSSAMTEELETLKDTFAKTPVIV